MFTLLLVMVLTALLGGGTHYLLGSRARAMRTRLEREREQRRVEHILDTPDPLEQEFRALERRARRRDCPHRRTLDVSTLSNDYPHHPYQCLACGARLTEEDL